MAGDPSNASLWTDADVYVGPVTAANPANANAPFGSDWGLVGLLDGDDGMPESRDEDTDDKFAWGGILALVATIFPDGSKVLFDRQGTPVLQSLAVAPSTQSVAVGAIASLTATATYDDTSTQDVTTTATWTSSAPTKATVTAGFVKGIATGSATVTAAYSGQTATCAVTVTSS
ncbi:hypothetical protein ACZ90_10520 [Streptomyces albus subsp. albus]|nr:hypothetical protein ACZ90_10520 [Streptomyces albus subsp. albus]